LTNSTEFQLLFQRGKRIDRPSCLVLWTPTSGARRVGFAVSRQLNHAVDRNRVRRRLREAYRATREIAPPSVAIIVVGKKRVLEMKFPALVEELHGAFSAMSGAAVGAGARP
jgi:ribonuclease P protein component